MQALKWDRSVAYAEPTHIICPWFINPSIYIHAYQSTTFRRTG
jgi:hypothetical protein